MSECVVRMEMPTLEKGCRLAIGNEYMFCQIEARWCNFYELGAKCPSWCPIVCSLPEGHGRLIDWDAFERAGFKLCRKTSECIAELGTPTNESYIVPAERREE